MNLRLDWATYKSAEYACTHWHYSKTIPRTRLNKIGVWENKKFTGVIIYSMGACNNLVKPYGLGKNEGCELTRIALRGHQNSVSKMISISLKMLKSHNLNLRLVVSFADPYQGHNGTVYQAGNWIYTGETAPTVVYKDMEGKLWHPRNVGKDLNKVAIQRKRSQCKKTKRPGKYRYLYPLDKAMRKQIEPLAQPYPKRPVSIDSDAESDQDSEGGASPTAGLYENGKVIV